jgi:hypothetical protein
MPDTAEVPGGGSTSARVAEPFESFIAIARRTIGGVQALQSNFQLPAGIAESIIGLIQGLIAGSCHLLLAQPACAIALWRVRSPLLLFSSFFVIDIFLFFFLIYFFSFDLFAGLVESRAVKMPVIGLYGKTGAGKSTLGNILLGGRAFPVGLGANSCTPCITEVTRASGNFRYSIERPNAYEWRARRVELARMLEQKGDQSLVAKTILDAVYGSKRDRRAARLTDPEWEDSRVTKVLSDIKVHEFKTGEALVEDIKSKLLLPPPDKKSPEAPRVAYWPLVNKVHIPPSFPPWRVKQCACRSVPTSH